MDVVGLQDPAQVRLVRRAGAQPLDRRFFVAEGLKEREGKLTGIERLLSESRYRLFNFYGVHACSGGV
jgi:hypothetical protein